MRLFFGLPLPPSARQAVFARAQEAQCLLSGRYSLPENYHLTLAFLGEVADERVPDAQAVLRECTASFPAPTVTLGAVDHFGRADRAILILRAQSDPSLEPLHEKLVIALKNANLPCDLGPFSPHVTLARRADATRLPSLAPACFSPCAAFRAPHACLYLSARDEADVLRYTPLFRANFA